MEEPRTRSRWRWPIAVVVVVLILVGGRATFLVLRGPQLSQATIEQRVAEDLGIAGKPKAWVSCPASEPERKGAQFSCDVYGLGQAQSVLVTETSSTGTFRYTFFPRGRRFQLGGSTGP